MPESNYFDFVVVGAMNPRIHHPSWYRQVDIISEQEYEEAIKAPGTLGILGFAQLEIPSLALRISCNEEKWEIRTDNREQLDRLQKITWEVFDKILLHTPVTIFGANFNFVRSTNCENVPQFLAKQAVGMGLGLVGDSALDSSVNLRRTHDDGVAQIVVQSSSTSKNEIVVLCNYEYKFGAGTPGFFSLEQRVAEKVTSALKDGEIQRDLIVRTINEKAGR